MKIYIVVTDVVNDEHACGHMLFMTLSTGKQRRHMIKLHIKYLFLNKILFISFFKYSPCLSLNYGLLY